jgi:bifunctional DNA-binding transcriptional regulator/antitoxin component of YhaV-PrlF toxin-antitoxin module
MTYQDVEKEIIKTTKLYSDGKTQVPKEVIELLKLKRGSQMLWVREGHRVFIVTTVSLE